MATLLIAILVIIITAFIIANFWRPKNLPPTIFPIIPIIGHLYLLKSPLTETLANLSARFGPILFLKFGVRNVLIVADPVITEECFTKTNDVIFANRPKLLFARIVAHNFTNTAWLNYGPVWQNLRKIEATEFFSADRISQFYDIRANEGKVMVQGLLPVSATSKVANLKAVFGDYCVNNVIMAVAGKRYSADDLALGRQLQDIVRDTFALGNPSNLGDYLPWLKYFGYNKDTEKAMWAIVQRRDSWFANLLEEFREGKGVLIDKNITMVGVFLKLQAADPEQYPDEFITPVMLNILCDAIAKCSSTLEWALALLLNNPRVLKKAQEEIDSIVGTDRLVEESDLNNLPYLNCVVKETMRLYPVVPVLVPHESSEDCVVSGYDIPKGTMLIVNQWGIHRDALLWNDPEKFFPERFELEITPKLKFLPFGFGLRMCPADDLANPLVGLALALVIQCFNWERLSDELVDMTEGGGLVLVKAQALIAKCTPRPITESLTSQASIPKSTPPRPITEC
uniref:cytochrome P450 81Q32-like n=1 Tax=Erigeron canadensis TaxID=72917 RepID=UPI001CB936CD|nr:cytochrome P450 81Q32-like [Erigeron canadensis]